MTYMSQENLILNKVENTEEISKMNESEQYDLANEIHLLRDQIAELSQNVLKLSKTTEKTAEVSNSLSLMVYILTTCSVLVSVASMSIAASVVMLPAESSELIVIVSELWWVGFVGVVIMFTVGIGCSLFWIYQGIRRWWNKTEC